MKVRLSHIIIRRNGITMSTTWSFAWKRLRSLWTIPDLRNKILFTLGLLLIYRVLAHVIVPLTHQEQANLVNLFGSNKSQNLGQLLGLLDVFSGGSLQTFSIVALGLAPYITATIVMQLLQPIIPALHNLATQGEVGRLRISQLTRLITVPLAFLQALGQSAIFVREGVLDANTFSLFGPNWLETLAILLSLTTGTMILVWIGGLITERGIGNGISDCLDQTKDRGNQRRVKALDQNYRKELKTYANNISCICYQRLYYGCTGISDVLSEESWPDLSLCV